MLDGGREMKPGGEESMRFGGLTPGHEAAILLRTAPVEDTTLRLRVNGEALPPLSIGHRDAWAEPVVRVPARLVRASLDVSVANDGPGEFVDYHAWVAQ